MVQHLSQPSLLACLRDYHITDRPTSLCRMTLPLATNLVLTQVADVIRHTHMHGKHQVAARLAAALVDCGQVAILTEAAVHLASQVCAAHA